MATDFQRWTDAIDPLVERLIKAGISDGEVIAIMLGTDDGGYKSIKPLPPLPSFMVLLNQRMRYWGDVFHRDTWGRKEHTNGQAGQAKPAAGPPPDYALEEFGAFVQRVRNDPEPPFVVEDFVPHNGLVIVGGQPKTMKSLAIVQLGVAASASAEFLGRSSNSSPAFVYVTEEGTRTMHADRIERFVAAHPEAKAHIVYRQQVRLAVLDTLKASVHALITKHGSALVVIDPLRDYMPSGRSEKDDDAIATVKAYLRSWLSSEPNLTIGLVHHVVKDESRQGDARALSGSGAIYAMADATILWYAKKVAGQDDDDDDAPLIRVGGVSGHCIVESRSRPPVSIDWVYDHVTGLVVPGTAAAFGWADRVLAALDGHDISTDGLYATFRANRGDKAAIRSALQRLLGRGQVRLAGPPPGFWTRRFDEDEDTYVRTDPSGDEVRTEVRTTANDGLFTANDDPYHPERG